MTLNYKQLAFILDIKPVEALEKIIFVYCKVKGKQLPRSENTVKEYLFEDREYLVEGKIKTRSVRNDLPEFLDIGLLALHLNIPTLQQAVQDIQNNYLVRPATKKWILCDYPEKQLKSCSDNDKPLRIPFPKALESLLPTSISDKIREEWRTRFPKARVV